MDTLLGNNNAATRLKTINNVFFFDNSVHAADTDTTVNIVCGFWYESSFANE